MEKIKNISNEKQYNGVITSKETGDIVGRIYNLKSIEFNENSTILESNDFGKMILISSDVRVTAIGEYKEEIGIEKIKNDGL